VPRRNRRPASHRAHFDAGLTAAAQRRELEHFAREHLAAHADAVATSLPDELAMTGSEHPRTGIRFCSAGDCLDRLALRLVDRADDPSDASGNLG